MALDRGSRHLPEDRRSVRLHPARESEGERARDQFPPGREIGLEAQQASVRAFVSAQGWTLVAEFSDIASGKDDRRPGFQTALTRCRQLGAVLAAARLDRITRRVLRRPNLTLPGVLLSV